MKTIQLSVLAVLLLAAISPTASATALLPGTSVVPANGTGASTYALLSSMTSAFTSGLLSGTLTSEVYQVSPGLDQFWFQVSNNAGSQDNVSRFTISGFLPSFGSMDVVYRTDIGGGGAGAVVPLSVGLTNTGVFGIDFGSSSGTQIAANKQSPWVVVQVSTPYGFTINNAAVIDGVAMNTTAYSPAVPEPSSWMLAGMGAALIAVRRFRRTRAG